jgi:hypothetical protein
MIGFATQRLMEPEAEGQTGAAYGEKNPERLGELPRVGSGYFRPRSPAARAIGGRLPAGQTVQAEPYLPHGEQACDQGQEPRCRRLGGI